MDLFGAYGNSDTDSGSSLPPSPSLRAKDARDAPTATAARRHAAAIALAPPVDDLDEERVGLLIATNNDSSYNAPRSIMHNAPLAGPSHPNQSWAPTNVWSGQATDVAVASYHFDDMYNQQRGTAANGGGDVGGPPKKKSKSKKGKRPPESVRPTSGIALDRPFYLKSSQPWADEPVEATDPVEGGEGEGKGEGEGGVGAGAGAGVAKAAAPEDPARASVKTSVFHGSADDLEDYQERSWIDVPKGYKQTAVDKCRVPKKTVHTWSSHSKGVSAVRFHPSGHLLLSAGLDGTAKISRVYDNRKCMRTYLGHTKGIRTVEFAGTNGEHFVTTSFDKTVKLWDTETGAVVTSFDTKNAMSFALGTHPAHPSILLAGFHKKVVQFDTRTGDNLQEYDYHLDAINSITFVDEGRKFITSSDDKTIRVWEFGVPVQVQVIKDTTMHAVSAASLSPDGSTWIGQNADNTIVSYSVTDSKVRQMKKKTFQGHSSAGYAIDVGISPDGQYVFSGDGEGRVFFWNWKSKRVSTISSHQKVCVGCRWHPYEPSTLAICSWDGTVKLHT